MEPAERKGLILVVDDEESIRHTLSQILADEGYEVVTAASGEEGVDRAVEIAPDAVFLDVWLPGIDGIETLRLLRERGVFASIVMISGHGTIETAVRATKLGAYDFVEKPLSLERVLLVTANAIRHARLERQNRALRVELLREAEFIGRSPAVERLRGQLAEAVDGRPVLIHGERGTGRRLAARWITLHADRSRRAFVDLQVSSLPRERLIRALYGTPSDPGASAGRLAMADEGTLYLENAETLPPAVQASLLAGLRDGAFPVPGRRRVVRSEPLLVISLSEPPETAVEQGRLSGAFLSAFPHVIEIPPLRERREDFPELIARFLGDLCREYGRETLELTPEALRVLLAYDWPGNVRELQRTLERIVLLAAGPLVRPEDLPAYIAGTEHAAERSGIETTLERFERDWLERCLAEVGGDLPRAAARLGLGVDELRERLTRLGLA
ncbi:MAG: sigma-54 dependent transcriptional regulator [Acidobacteriota bacterium]|nr:MAG: sigma-54-dependent Fis family transcriptional regulator [Acidobacteriota bacterium]